MLADPEKIKNELVLWIRQYFLENGASCAAVIGISGGKDSSIVAALCAEALGAERVIGVLMPNGLQTDITFARKLVQHLNIPSVELNIADAVAKLNEMIVGNKTLYGISGRQELSEAAKVNLPARVRMTTLYAVAQMLPNGGRVANTCNRSEDYVGYSTKYGDSAGDFSPLSDLVVEEVKQIGEAIGLPEELVQKIPTDGLSGLTDEEKLGFSYKELDQYIIEGTCVSNHTKYKIKQTHTSNIHKLAPMPAYKLQESERFMA